ncbi:MAG: hypothetical protein ACE5NP_08200 [Anaerolineae bacterium]
MELPFIDRGTLLIVIGVLIAYIGTMIAIYLRDYSPFRRTIRGEWDSVVGERRRQIELGEEAVGQEAPSGFDLAPAAPENWEVQQQLRLQAKLYSSGLLFLMALIASLAIMLWLWTFFGRELAILLGYFTPRSVQ